MKREVITVQTLNEWKAALGFSWVALASGTRLSYPSVTNWARQGAAYRKGEDRAVVDRLLREPGHTGANCRFVVPPRFRNPTTRPQAPTVATRPERSTRQWLRAGRGAHG